MNFLETSDERFLRYNYFKTIFSASLGWFDKKRSGIAHFFTEVIGVAHSLLILYPESSNLVIYKTHAIYSILPNYRAIFLIFGKNNTYMFLMTFIQFKHCYCTYMYIPGVPKKTQPKFDQLYMETIMKFIPFNLLVDLPTCLGFPKLSLLWS